MFKSLSRSVEWMPLWNFDFNDKSLIANEQKTAFLHNTGILLRKINQTMQKNVFYEIFVQNNQFIYKIQFSSLKTSSPIMLSGEWLTMMLSSVGPVNSLGYRSVTINLCFCQYMSFRFIFSGGFLFIFFLIDGFFWKCVTCILYFN